MCQSTSEAGTLSASPTHSPWRTVRLGSRTAWRRRPRSCAIIGAVAATTPIENSSTTNMTLTPSTLAASASGPSQPIITTSVVWIATWPTLVSTIGTASAASARASRRQAPAPWPLQVPIIVAMMPSYYCKTASAGTRHGHGAGIRHPCRRSCRFDSAVLFQEDGGLEIREFQTFHPRLPSEPDTRQPRGNARPDRDAHAALARIRRADPRSGLPGKRGASTPFSRAAP